MIYFIWILLSILIAYLYFGFPLLLMIFANLFNKTHKTDSSYMPTVTLIVSAYNEEKTIRSKLENCLNLNYPKDKLSILIVSDCSDDQTDSIVREYENQGIKLFKLEKRSGKTSGLNSAMKTVSTEMVIFSDANAIYDPEAINNLVRHFIDPTVGYAVGHARYYSSLSTAAKSENIYWNLECLLKKWESDFFSVVGGDGAIYMIRTELYLPLEESDINDFVNPLQIIAQGYRGIFDRDAFCIEEASEDFEKEFGRKVRIVNRSFNGLLRVKQLLNPFHYPRFSWLLFSHKLLRWFSPALLLAHFFLSLALVTIDRHNVVGTCILSIYLLISVFSIFGYFLNRSHRYAFRPFFLSYYFVLMNVASFYGVIRRLMGEKIVTWNTVRNTDVSLQTGSVLVLIVSILMMLFSSLKLILTSQQEAFLVSFSIVLLSLVLLYTYIGYPLVLFIISLFYRQTHITDDAYRPSMTLLIAAYNEASVLEEKLKNALALDYPTNLLTIVVASDGSTDDTNKIVETFIPNGVRLIALTPNRGKVTALNQAMKDITSDIVVLSDANVMYQQDALKKIARHFADSSIGAVSGKVILLNDDLSYSDAENKYYSIEHYIQKSEGETGSMIGSDGAMYAFRRELYPYPPADTILDDFVISMSIVKRGYRLIHARDALGYEHNIQEIKGEYQRKVRIIAGGIQCLLRREVLPPARQLLTWVKFISHKVLRWLCGPTLALLLLFTLYSWLTLVPLGWLAAGLTYFLLGTVALELCSAVIKGLRSFIIFSMLHYFFMLHVASIMGCWRGVLGRQSVTWKRT